MGRDSSAATGRHTSRPRRWPDWTAVGFASAVRFDRRSTSRRPATSRSSVRRVHFDPSLSRSIVAFRVTHRARTLFLGSLHRLLGRGAYPLASPRPISSAPGVPERRSSVRRSPLRFTVQVRTVQAIRRGRTSPADVLGHVAMAFSTRLGPVSREAGDSLTAAPAIRVYPAADVPFFCRSRDRDWRTGRT